MNLIEQIKLEVLDTCLYINIILKLQKIRNNKIHWKFQVALEDNLLNISENSKSWVIICEIELYFLQTPTLIKFRTMNMT